LDRCDQALGVSGGEEVDQYGGPDGAKPPLQDGGEWSLEAVKEVRFHGTPYS